MKILKIVIPAFILLTVVFSFVKIENNIKELDLNSIDVKELLTKNEFECRPSSKYMFYVDTEILKKSRGYSIIKADVFLYERASGTSALIATNNIISPLSKDAIIGYKNELGSPFYKKIKNGDKAFGYKSESLDYFNELMNYKSIYKSFEVSRDKLLSANTTR